MAVGIRNLRSSGGALCPLKRGQLTRERQQGCIFSFRHNPLSFLKRNGVVIIKKHFLSEIRIDPVKSVFGKFKNLFADFRNIFSVVGNAYYNTSEIF